VRVNTVSPGFVPTNIIAHQTTAEERKQYYGEDIAKDHALGRCGTVDELSNAVVFLASDDASFITGTDLGVDGGYLVHKHAASN
jgi:NAD(P)-dependent dehydrogenase (short-subunit alcohol dehydrogenase family)